MAAVTVVKCRPCTPVGYEYIVRGTLVSAVVAGDQLVNGASGWDLAATSAVAAQGIALTNGYAGQDDFDIGLIGEMDGFSGMTPGAALYPSSGTAGKLDTTATTFYSAGTTPAVAVPVKPQVRALSATRIYYNYV